jgi:hypothetical protein
MRVASAFQITAVAAMGLFAQFVGQKLVAAYRAE